jgi:transcriptional regulator with XRE-family HTH domain
MPAPSLNSFGDGASMPPLSHTVTFDAIAVAHNLCVPHLVTECDMAAMDTNSKNGGPNHLRAWRLKRDLTQEQLAERVGTNPNMIGYLESGERGLSAKWLRRLADALETTPGMILEHDPDELDADVLDIWAHGDLRQKRQLSEIAKALIRTGTNG